MKRIRILCFVISLIFCVLSYPVYASDSPAYKKLINEEPVYTMDVTVEQLLDFYKASSTDEILDLTENNYTEGAVSVGGIKTVCHVYMRTFSITDIGNYKLSEAKALADSIFEKVKGSLSEKYMKCIARSYSINISGIPDKATDTYKSFTVKFLIAAGESNEERASVINEFVKPAAATWEGLDIGDKIIKLNEFLLNGQFSYDISKINRSSIYAFINDKKGVCEEYAGLTSLFLDEFGCKNSIITGKVNGEGHMWNIAYVNDRPYHLDILHNGPVDENGAHVEITRDFLLVSSEKISASRTPDKRYEEVCKSAVYDYIFEGVPTSLPTDIFNITDGMINTVPVGTPVASLKEAYEEGSAFLVFTSKDGKILADDELVGSGCVISIEANGKIIDSATFFVMGDVNGDGITDKNDLDAVAAVIMRREGTEGLEVFCDMNLDKAVTVTDFLLFSVLAGTISL